jgi:hypothetical protein
LALADLSARRPALATRLAEACLAAGLDASALVDMDNAGEEGSVGGRPAANDAGTGQAGGPASEHAIDPAAAFDHLAAALRQAHAFRLAARPDRSVTLLAEALRSLRRQRGHLSAALAQSLEMTHASGDAVPGSANWRDAAQETSLETGRAARP